MPAPLLVDLSHTSHTRARTGVQRVARGLVTALGADACPVTYDPFAREWRMLSTSENRLLSGASPARGRRAHWSQSARWAGRLRRWLGRGAEAALPPSRGLIVPEIFSAREAAAYPSLFRRTAGPRVAIFHDGIALQMPEHYPSRTAARFASYLIELAQFDGVAAISEAMRRSLIEYWDWAGVASPPPVAAIPLGIAPFSSGGPPRLNLDPQAPPRVLCVSSLEGRKNHVALLRACESLWQRGLTFDLQLIGIAHPESGAAAMALVRELQRKGRPVRYEGAVDEATLEAAYAGASFTVYPSLAEGFGLPVAESLLRGKPCLCSSQGALGEIASDGGCLTVAEPTEAALAEACAALIEHPERRAELAAAAMRRRFKTPAEHAREMVAWMETLVVR